MGITHKNSANNYALVASGGAAGGGNLVVSESQAYGLLITGTILASWDTHAGKIPNSKRSEVLKYFEGYYNFWKQMCKDSWNENTNCQSGGSYCEDSNGGSSVCLPDWRHYKTGGSESTGPAPDADEDAIVGIMLAVKAVENDRNKPSWYEEARVWADASATAFYEFEVDKSKPDHRLVKLGACWGGWNGDGNNPSYHSPGHFRVMKDYKNRSRIRCVRADTAPFRRTIGKSSSIRLTKLCWPSSVPTTELSFRTGPPSASTTTATLSTPAADSAVPVPRSTSTEPRRPAPP